MARISGVGFWRVCQGSKTVLLLAPSEGLGWSPGCKRICGVIAAHGTCLYSDCKCSISVEEKCLSINVLYITVYLLLKSA